MRGGWLCIYTHAPQEIDVGEPGKTFGIKVTDIFAKGKRKVVDAIAKEHKETFDNIGEVGGNITTQFNIKSTIGKMGAINKAEDKKVNRSTYVDQVTALKKPGVKGRKAKATPSLREHRVKQSQDGVKKHGDAPMQSYNQRTSASRPPAARSPCRSGQHAACLRGNLPRMASRSQPCARASRGLCGAM